MCVRKVGNVGGGEKTPKKCSKTNSTNTNTNSIAFWYRCVRLTCRLLSILALHIVSFSMFCFRCCSLLFVLRMPLNLDVMVCCCSPECWKIKRKVGLVWFCVVNAYLLNLPDTLYNRCIPIRLWLRNDRIDREREREKKRFNSKMWGRNANKQTDNIDGEPKKHAHLH